MKPISLKQIHQAANGNKKAQGEIFKFYHFRVFNFILRRLDKIEDAQDILQETFISVFEALPFYSGKASLFTWICAIANHEVTDFYRRKKIKMVVFSVFPGLRNLVSQALGPEAIFEEKEMKRKIYRVLTYLSEGYREVLRLKYIEGFSVKEIAQQLNQTEKAIESRLTRARKAFAYYYVKPETNWQGS